MWRTPAGTRNFIAMRLDRLHDARRARPFRPFTLVSGDGRRVRVEDPERMMLNPFDDRTIIVIEDREPRGYRDHFFDAAAGYELNFTPRADIEVRPSVG